MSLSTVPAMPPSSTRTGTVAAAAVALVVGLGEVGLGGWFWYATATDTSDSAFVGLGYVVAAFVGVPGLAALLLAALGWWLAGRVAGVVLAVLGLVAAAFPLLVGLSLFSTSV